MTPPAASGLPQLLAALAEAIGVEAALALADARGGQRVHVPKSIDAGHWIARAIGARRAEELARAYGGESLDLPAARTGSTLAARRRCDRALAEGASLNQAVAASGLTRRGVQWRKANKLRRGAGGPQGDLFD